MKVWIVVTDYPYETKEIEEIYRQKGRAEKRAAEMNKARKKADPHTDAETQVEEWGVE